jgi:hypothetical protein
VPRNFRIAIFLYKKKDKSNNIFRGLNGGPVENEVIGRQTVQVKNRDKIRCVAVKYRERGMHGDLVPESVDMRKAVKVIYFARLFWILAKTQSLHIKKYHKFTFFFQLHKVRP